MLVATAGVACEWAGSDGAPKGGIAFAIELDGDWRLATASADGSGDLAVYSAELPWQGDRLSPDGTKTAGFEDSGVWVIDADGTGLRQVTAESDAAYGFAWSPDGGQLAFVEGLGLYVEHADGANRRLLVRCQCLPDVRLAWSPDGRTVAYAEGADPDLGLDASTQIHLVDADGTGKRALTPGGAGPPPELSWSPDGRQIAFTRPPIPYVMGSDGRERDNPDGPVVYVIGRDGSGERRLGPGEGPVWSPVGTGIAFTRGGIVYAIESDGTGERKLGPGYNPSWSPAGAQIAVSRQVREPYFTVPETAIWLWNADGSGGRQIWPREGLCECGAPTWLPD